MRIKAKIEVDIPMGFYCKGCLRNEEDRKGCHFCTLFNKYIYIRNGNFLKCRECVNMVYDEIDKMD